MSQYCSSQGANKTGQANVATNAVIEQKMDVRFKEMERRLRRTLGEPPEINYTVVEETIHQRFKGVEERVVSRLGEPPEVNYTAIDMKINDRFRLLEARVNGYGDGPSIVDYSRIERTIDARFQNIQRYVDSKFALLVNDTQEYEKAMETMAARRNVSDCGDVRLEDAKLCNATGGVFDLYKDGKKFEVYCDTYTDGGGWTILQRRIGGALLFNRTMEEYAEGFGDPSGELWLGLDNLHQLTEDDDFELKIELTDTYGRHRFQKYDGFHVTGKAGRYTLIIKGSNVGDLGDYISSRHGQAFQIGGSYNTLVSRYSRRHGTCTGGWWGCYYQANLNNRFGGKSDGYAIWNGFQSYNLAKTEMKFRKVKRN